MVAHVVDAHNVLVPQARDRHRFPLEPRQLVWMGVVAGEEHLQGHGAVESQVPCLVDDAHPAAAEHRFDLVARDLGESRRVR